MLFFGFFLRNRVFVYYTCTPKEMFVFNDFFVNFLSESLGSCFTNTCSLTSGFYV